MTSLFPWRGEYIEKNNLKYEEEDRNNENSKVEVHGEIIESSKNKTYMLKIICYRVQWEWLERSSKFQEHYERKTEVFREGFRGRSKKV